MEKTSLYIHIPFCQKKCLYCDFLSFQKNPNKYRAYSEALINEIKNYKNLHNLDKVLINTIFFGGGTPSIVEASEIASIMEAIDHNFKLASNAEISIEVNPDSLDNSKARAYKKLGINRISLGLQSANDNELKKLGRIHDYLTFEKNYKMLRQEGFSNINVDLMYNIPDQTLKTLSYSLDKVVGLEPDHISAYSLIIEEGTPFYLMDIGGRLNLSDEETERNMYYLIKDRLAKANYKQYEISNYSLDNYECQHNLAYWSDKDYIGLGLGASSYIGGARYKNTDDYQAYLNASHKARILIQENDQKRRREEYFFLGLRKTKGIKIEDFNKTFMTSLLDDYDQELKDLIKQGLLEIDSGYLRLTDRGLDFSNRVFLYFMKD